MAALSESLTPKIKTYLDGYFAQNQVLDPFIEWIEVAKVIHTKFDAPSLIQKTLALNYFTAKVQELREKQAKAREAWFYDKPLK